LHANSFSNGSAIAGGVNGVNSWAQLEELRPLESITTATATEAGLLPAAMPWTDLSFSSTPPGWAVNSAKGKATMDSNGVWDVTINVDASATAFNSLLVTIDGVAPLGIYPLASDPNTGTNQASCNITPAGVVRIVKTTTATTANFSGTFICSSKPTFL